MSQRRVVITGLGVINALAADTTEYFQALLDGRIGVDRIKSFDPSEFTSQVAGEAPDFDIRKAVPKAHRKATKLMSRDIQLAVVATDAAVRDAKLNTKGLDPNAAADIDPTRSGVNIGAGIICCDLIELAAAAAHGVVDGKFNYQQWGHTGMQSLTPLWLLKYLPNMPSCHVSIIHDCQGPSNAVTCAEAAGQLAIAEAARTIARGAADVMIAGGAESKVNGMDLLRQCLLNRASTKFNDNPNQASRPFDADADGNVVAEGAGIVVLEELEHARARGARIYAEIVGCGASHNFSSDVNLVDPEPQGTGIAIAMKKALQHAGVSPDQIDLLVPNGLATPAADRAEVNAINTVFGDGSSTPPIFATKSRIGNAGAGAAAVDLVTTVLALHANQIPATLNCPTPPAELTTVTTQNTQANITYALTSCYTFGGQTAAILLKKPDV